MCKFHFFLLLTLGAFTLVACGGSKGGISGEPDTPSISISPMNPSILVGQTQVFTANIQNLGDTRVAWSVQEENGGTIASTDAGGVYTAPWPTGIYHVVATAVADASVTTNTMVAVTAKFAFLQEYPSGDAIPFSMTPMLATVGSDGHIGLLQLVDTSTGNPVSAAIQSLVVSPDGKKGIFDMLTPDTQHPGAYLSNIYLANADGTGERTQLTQDGNATLPQFSRDRTKIVYVTKAGDIYVMNADGSDQHPVFAATTDAWAYSATFSPDGTKIAAELEWEPNGVYQDGIAIMDADGSNAFPLTYPNACIGWDEMPAFTNDGTNIMFSEYCYTGTASYEGLYSITPDGATRRLLLGADVGTFHYNPIPAGGKIVFQSNNALLGISSFEIFSMNADGSGLTQVTSNDVYDGFDLNWWNLVSASVQQQANARALPGPRTRGDRIRAILEHHR